MAIEKATISRLTDSISEIRITAENLATDDIANEVERSMQEVIGGLDVVPAGMHRDGYCMVIFGHKVVPDAVNS